MMHDTVTVRNMINMLLNCSESAWHSSGMVVTDFSNYRTAAWSLGNQDF